MPPPAVLESYSTRKRGKTRAPRFMKKALKRDGSPGKITTAGLLSYGAAMDELLSRPSGDGSLANSRDSAGEIHGAFHGTWLCFDPEMLTNKAICFQSIPESA